MLSVNHLGFPPLLTILLFLPAAGALLTAVLGRGQPFSNSDRRDSQSEGIPAPQDAGEGSTNTSPRGDDIAKVTALVTALVTFGLSLFFVAKFQTSAATVGLTKVCTGPGACHTTSLSRWTIQFAEHGTWFPSLGISYFVAMDGINVWLVALCTGATMLAIGAACFMIKRRVSAFLALMLLAETGMLGVFLSWNLFLFYIFWELMLIPAYFLVGIWGESRRVYATTKFVIYTIFGSFLMLVAIFYLYATTPGHDLDLPALITHPPASGPQTWLFLAFLLAFGIKAGLFPFHSWAPDAYVEAPIPATVLIASVMAKTATFGIIRFALPIFPHAANQLSTLLSILALIGILYAASIALVQVDAKRTLAYASISHMNIILLGIFALDQQGIDGAILQMVNHAVIMAGLFFLVAMVYARSGARRFDQMSLLARTFPVMAAFMLLLFLAAMDLPGLGSFTGEFTILVGVFLRDAWLAAFAALVTIIAAWYAVRWFQSIAHASIPLWPNLGLSSTRLRPEADGTRQQWLAGRLFSRTREGSPHESRPASQERVEASPASTEKGETDGEPATAYQFPVLRPRIAVDLKPVEMALLLPIAAVIVWLGVVPKPFTDRTAPTVQQVTGLVQAVTTTVPAVQFDVAAPEGATDAGYTPTDRRAGGAGDTRTQLRSGEAQHTAAHPRSSHAEDAAEDLPSIAVRNPDLRIMRRASRRLPDRQNIQAAARLGAPVVGRATK